MITLHNLPVFVPLNSGAVINEKTPSNFNSLRAFKLNEGIVFMAKGKDGIALLHAGGKLSKDSYANLFGRIGKIEFWTMACSDKNQVEYKFLINIFKESFDRNYVESDDCFNNNAYPGIDRSGKFCHEFGSIGKDEKAFLLQLNTYLDRINFYSELENHFANDNEQLSYNLIFDGEKFNHPELDLERLGSLSLKCLDFPDQIDKLVEFRKVETTHFSKSSLMSSDMNPIKLKTAASLNNWPQIVEICTLGSPDTITKKNAFQKAKEKGHQEAMFVLNAYGAGKEEENIPFSRHIMKNLNCQNYVNTMAIVVFALFAYYLGSIATKRL
jgi:hypothetical protein